MNEWWYLMQKGRENEEEYHLNITINLDRKELLKSEEKLAHYIIAIMFLSILFLYYY
jgi:hypothetical protein